MEIIATIFATMFLGGIASCWLLLLFVQCPKFIQLRNVLWIPVLLFLYVIAIIGMTPNRLDSSAEIKLVAILTILSSIIGITIFLVTRKIFLHYVNKENENEKGN